VNRNVLKLFSEIEEEPETLVTVGKTDKAWVFQCDPERRL
jgi:hypothetical protein